jgi:hypothetical protein
LSDGLQQFVKLKRFREPEQLLRVQFLLMGSQTRAHNQGRGLLAGCVSELVIELNTTHLSQEIIQNEQINVMRPSQPHSLRSAMT